MSDCFGPRRVEAVSVVDQVTSELRRAIVTGELAPGVPLSLRKLADRLGVSFIPVREALRSLEAEGLVVTPRARSARVAPLESEQLRALFRIRIGLEPDLTSRGSQAVTDWSPIEASLADLGNVRLPFEKRREAHAVFHAGLMEPVASDWDKRVRTMLWHASERYVRFAFHQPDSDPDEVKRDRDSHTHLIEVARAGSVSDMANAVDAHLKKDESIVLAALEAAGLSGAREWDQDADSSTLVHSGALQSSGWAGFPTDRPTALFGVKTGL